MAQTPQSIRKCYLCGREGDDSQTCVSNWNEEYKLFHLPLPLLPTLHEGTSIVVCKKHYLEARRHHDDPSYLPQWKRGHQEKMSMKCMYPQCTNTSDNSNISKAKFAVKHDLEGVCITEKAELLCK